MPSFTHVIAALTAAFLGLKAVRYATAAARQANPRADLYCAACALASVLLAAYMVGGRR
ncbi:hypothetical protein [Streptomyces sp. NPDC051554]|uniref:hypothetical protein n=1 Tax=Streptomyces sp. NPDC051554 TaxID=3365656 RepID=UPI0037B88A8D